MNTVEELKEWLLNYDYDDSVYFMQPDYVTAIEGISEEGRIIYNYDKMVEFLVEKDNMTPEEAEDFISYNTIRAIPYMGEKKPIVMYTMMD